MESLGGDTAWFDRFAAQHAALLYYWLVTGLFMASPESAYNFSLLVEEHAYVTYAVFAEENAQLLQSASALESRGRIRSVCGRGYGSK
ncbi:unnamed protein product [Effrenium voratum]|uniref:Uncharacterized protein n=1 Tax=Effrenium voratum TaxID=2562239 RepID=A0AA36HKU8_9DINO|nr:unnamed protein product [Effrenium voratum]